MKVPSNRTNIMMTKHDTVNNRDVVFILKCQRYKGSNKQLNYVWVVTVMLIMSIMKKYVTQHLRRNGVTFWKATTTTTTRERSVENEIITYNNIIRYTVVVRIFE